MIETQKDQIRYELLRCITSLQDAFAYCNHAELLCREYRMMGERMRIGGLRQQINGAIGHAAILRDSVRS